MRHGVVNLKSVYARDPLRAGGKGSGLARLHRYGFDVPDGFVIGTPVFHDMIHQLGIESRLNASTPSAESPVASPAVTRVEPLPISDSLADVRRAILNGALPDAARRRIASTYRKLGGRVAVRSSMVGEDDARTSLAGQLDTVLNVDSEEGLLAAIKNCYASICGARLQRYLAAVEPSVARQHRKTPSLALVVQRMMTGVIAGVSFSADPRTGRRCVIIEAAAGPTNTVADGTAEPMRWVVNARGVLVDKQGISNDNTTLPDNEVLRLAGLVRKIEACFGCPQDVEWIWDGDRFSFLQARPITTLSGKNVYSNALVADMSPGLIKPLLWSTNTVSKTTNVFGRIFTELIGPNDIDFTRLSRRIHSRVYTNVTLLGELLQRIGLPANSLEMLARDETGERPPMKMSVARLLLHRRVLQFVARHARAHANLVQFVNTQDIILDRGRYADLAAATPLELMRLAEDHMVIHGESQWHVFLAAVNMMIRKRLLDRFLHRHVRDVSAADLLSGLPHLRSLEPNRRLDDMAALARGLGDELLARLVSDTDPSTRAALVESGRGRELIEAVDAFLREFGFLSASGTDFSTESWAERPELVWRTIHRLSVRLRETTPGSNDPLPEMGADPKNGEKLVQQIARSLGPLHRFWFKRLLRSTVSYMDLRERTSLLLSEDAYLMRRVFLELGRRLADNGELNDADDIFYLYIEELRAMVSEGRDRGDARTLIAKRRAEMEADALVEPLDTICGDEVPPREALYRRDSGWYPGIGGSPGVAEGRAVVLHDPSLAPRDLSRDDILVVPFTDVGWTPLFVGIGGIVAETGGQLSHTCIVAREYRLPAVVSVRGATRLFKDGEPITIDGHRGRVHVGHILSQKRSMT